MALYIIAPFVLLVVVLIPIIISSSNPSTQAEKEVAEKAQKKKLSGKQRARKIAFILMVLAIISGIAEVIKKGGFGYSDMIDIPFNIAMTYCLVMFVGYPIARRIAGKGRKPKDEQNRPAVGYGEPKS